MPHHRPETNATGRSRRRHARTGAIAVVATLLAACGSDDGTSTTEPITIDRDRIVAATSVIETTGCGPRVRYGRATVVDDGLLITAAHVVAGADTVDVVADGARSAADVVFFDPDIDVAGLRVEQTVVEPVELSSGELDGGAPAIVVLDRSDDDTPPAEWEVLDVAVGDPLTIRTTDIYRGRDVERDGFKVAAVVDEGDSGSMVHQADGGVGIIWARSNIESDQAWAVAIPEVFLDADTRAALTAPVDTGGCA